MFAIPNMTVNPELYPAFAIPLLIVTITTAYVVNRYFAARDAQPLDVRGPRAKLQASPKPQPSQPLQPSHKTRFWRPFRQRVHIKPTTSSYGEEGYSIGLRPVDIEHPRSEATWLRQPLPTAFVPYDPYIPHDPYAPYEDQGIQIYELDASPQQHLDYRTLFPPMKNNLQRQVTIEEPRDENSSIINVQEDLRPLPQFVNRFPTVVNR
jgi:hypothetical protein